MRRGLIDSLLDLLRGGSRTTEGAAAPAPASSRAPAPAPAPAQTRRKPAGTPKGQPRSDRPADPPTRPSRPQRPAGGRPAVEPPASDIDGGGLRVEYTPCLDGDPDPGEVVWTWVPYEDDPSQGKDRPVVVIGRRGDNLAGVPLTSKQHDNELQVDVGTGPWDREGRPSYAKVERLLEVDPEQVRREGAVLPRARFDEVVAGVRRAQARDGH